MATIIKYQPDHIVDMVRLLDNLGIGRGQGGTYIKSVIDDGDCTMTYYLFALDLAPIFTEIRQKEAA
jgi:hypothetical protein